MFGGEEWPGSGKAALAGVVLAYVLLWLGGCGSPIELLGF